MKNNAFSVFSPRAFNWDMLGLGLCRLWITQFMTFTILTGLNFSAATSALFFIPASIVCLLAGFLSLKGPLARARTATLLVSVFSSVLGFLLCFIGIASQLIYCALPGMALVGIGAGLLQSLWGDRFACFSATGANLYTITAFLFSAIMAILLAVSDSMEFYFVIMVLIPLVSYVLLFRSFNAGHWVENDFPDMDAPEQDNLVKTGRFCFSIFVFVFIFNYAYHCFFSVSTLGSGVVSARNLANLVVMLVLLGIAIFTDKFNRMALYRIAFPTLMIAFVLQCILPAQYLSIPPIVAAIGYKLFDVLFWCVLVGIAHINIKRGLSICIYGVSATFGAMGLGVFCAYVEPFNSLNEATVLLVFLVLLALVAIILLPESFISQLFSHGSAKDINETLSMKETCSSLSKNYDLTSRETDVLELLAQGRTQGIIAEKLNIGVGTAHTHIAHIYQKLGVHSQQELIDKYELDAMNLKR